MARWKQPKLNSDVRLRKWPAGRLSQLKLFLGHLESAVGVSLAAQVEQSPKRKFSEFVPKIVPQDISTDTDFREIRIFFAPPRGLKNLLFYEYDISATSGFYNLDRFVSPDNSYVFHNLNDGFTYYIRIRVVTKDGEVGPWSNVISVTTALAQARGLYDGEEQTYSVKGGSAPSWWPVFERTYSSIGGTGYYSLDYDVKVSRIWVGDGNVEWTDVEFRWMELLPGESSYAQMGQEFNVTTYSTTDYGENAAPFYMYAVITDEYAQPLILPGAFELPRRGTFTQKVHQFTEGDYTIRLEARIIPDHNGSIFQGELYPAYSGQSTTTKFIEGSNAIIKTKNFSIFEVMVDD